MRSSANPIPHATRSRAYATARARWRAMLGLAAMVALLAVPTHGHAATITVSGTALETQHSVASGGLPWARCGTSPVSLAVDGVKVASVACSAADGSFSFTGVTVTATQTLTAYLDPTSGATSSTAGEQGVAYTRNAGTDVAGLAVSKGFLRIAAGSEAVTPAHVNAFDDGLDMDIPASSDGTSIGIAASPTTATIAMVVETGATFTTTGDSALHKLKVDGTWNGGGTRLTLSRPGTGSCLGTETVAALLPLCRTGAFTVAAGSVVRFAVDGGVRIADAFTGTNQLQTLEVSPATAGHFYEVDGSIDATHLSVGDGVNSVQLELDGTTRVLAVPGSVQVNAGALVSGDGNLETNGDLTGPGQVYDSALDVRIEAASALVQLGGTAGSAHWRFDHLTVDNTGSAATVRLAAGSTGRFLAYRLNVGSSSDVAVTTLDADTNDRDMYLYDDMNVYAPGRYEGSGIEVIDVADDIFVRGGTYVSNGGGVNVTDDVLIYSGGVMSMGAAAVSIGTKLDIQSGGTYDVVGAGTLSLAGPFRKDGAFNAGTGTVEFVGAGRSDIEQTGGVTFHNLVNRTANKPLRLNSFATGGEVTVSNLLTLRGTSCNARAGLASRIDGELHRIRAAAADVEFADIGDSEQVGPLATAANSMDSGSNTGWSFTTPCPLVSVSGNAYDADGTAWRGCDGTTAVVGMSVVGFRRLAVPCDPTTGAFTFMADPEPGQLMMFFLASPASGTGATYGFGPDADGAVSGIVLRESQVRISSDTGATPAPMTHATMETYDKTVAAAIPVDAWTWPAHDSLVDPGHEVLVEDGQAFEPGGAVTADALDVGSGATFTSTYLTKLTGSGTDASCDAAVGSSVPLCIRTTATFTVTGGIVRYVGTGATHVWPTTYGDLELEPAAGPTYQLGVTGQANTFTVVRDFEIGTGASASENVVVQTTAHSPSLTATEFDVARYSTFAGSGTGTITIAGDVEGNGSIDLTAGIFQVDATNLNSIWGDLAGYDWRFHDLLVSNSNASSDRVISANVAGTTVVRNRLVVGDPGGVLSGSDPADTRQARFNVDVADPVLDVDGEVFIAATGRLTASATSAFTVGRDFSNSGIFDAQGGTVTFDTTAPSQVWPAAATTFANLRTVTAGKVMRFRAGTTTNVSGTFTAKGTTCSSVVTLESSTAGSQWTINAGTVDMGYATLRDSIASPARVATGTGSLGNNTGWTFTGTCPAPTTMYAHDVDASAGTADSTTISSATPHLSWVNTGDAADAQRVEVMTTPLDGVVALWKFDTATGVAADSSGSGRTLALSGTPTSPAGQASFGQALGLDGTTQHASVTHSSLDLAGNLTIDAWIRVTDASGTRSIVAKGGGGLEDVGLGFSGGNLVARAVRADGTAFTTSVAATAVSGGAWHHVALVVDASNVLTMYVDGAPVGTPATVGGALRASGGLVRLGSDISGTAGFFAGELDDVRISSAARTAAEISGYEATALPHAHLLWASAELAVSCAAAVRCADVTYGGADLFRQDGRYYARTQVRVQSSSIWSVWSTPQWFEVDRSMTISLVSGSSEDLGAVVAGGTVTGTTQVEVTSTNANGYTLTATDHSDTEGAGGAGSIPDWTLGTDPPVNWPETTVGAFGISVLAATDGKDTARWGTGTAPTDFATLNYAGLRQASPTLLFERSTYVAGTDTVTVGYRAAPSASQAPGAYQAKIIYTLTAKP